MDEWTVKQQQNDTEKRPVRSDWSSGHEVVSDRLGGKSTSKVVDQWNSEIKSTPESVETKFASLSGDKKVVSGNSSGKVVRNWSPEIQNTSENAEIPFSTWISGRKQVVSGRLSGRLVPATPNDVGVLYLQHKDLKDTLGFDPKQAGFRQIRREDSDGRIVRVYCVRYD